jgi:hypothetical protein
MNFRTNLENICKMIELRTQISEPFKKPKLVEKEKVINSKPIYYIFSIGRSLNMYIS